MSHYFVYRATLRIIVVSTFIVYYTTAENSPQEINKTKFHLYTIATQWTESLSRYLKSAEINGMKAVEILGVGEKWDRGLQVNLLKTALKKLKLLPNFNEKIIMFTHSYDTLILGDIEKILKQFFKLSGANVLFGAESTCWPDETLANDYPEIVPGGKQYLNSGGFIGYASSIYDLLNTEEIQSSEDSQLYLTKLFLNKEIRSKYKMKLDTKSSIFHNLDGATEEIELKFVEGDPLLVNNEYDTTPLVLHGNRHAKSIVNHFGNYVPNNWNNKSGCTSCQNDKISLENIKDDRLPKILVGLFIERPTPFLEEFFTTISLLDYPKHKIHLFIHNNVKYHSQVVDNFFVKYKSEYAGVKLVLPEDEIKEWRVRNLAVEEALKRKCDYFLNVDAEARLDNHLTLKLLIEQNRGIVAPLLSRPYKRWSNFWGAIKEDGYYKRSSDYLEIISGNRRGLWNVPYITGAYLVNATLLKNIKLRPNYINNLMDSDMAFCLNNRNRDIFMHVSNLVHWGHLVNADSFETSHVSNELYQIFDNRLDWERRYVHPNWSLAVNDPRKLKDMMKDEQTMPCNEVFWFPIVTPKYCKELIAEMENHGHWSNITLLKTGGYENFPTVDLQLGDVGLEEQWQEFLRLYVGPLAFKVFTGYQKYKANRPPRGSQNFVVRYKPEEQRELKPHHDTSTYTINIALNNPHVDYQGGGCHFTRYECSVTETKLGWMIMHPGKLTHEHQGLPTTNGTRYILVSFLDP